MGRIRKEDLIKLVQSFEETVNVIEKGVDVDALAGCQSQASDLGNYIEGIYENTDTSEMIHRLEEFCECLYQICLPENIGNLHKLSKKMRRLLWSIESDIRHILPDDRKIAVFLPYKASMWDSLESIYLSMKEDEQYETYVVPIPYFDKNPDGTLGQGYYEGNDYPKNIPVTSWQKFSIEEMEPDIIYIHNPYDSWNYVTSVSPSYYASELKKHTKELVYIPYFVLQEVDPENQKAVDAIAHFITTPGVIYADKVIVQSEAMKQIYVNEYIKFAKKNDLPGEHQDRKYQESRILGTGSPKLEKARKTKKKDVEIPEKWLKLVEKRDGSLKKLFFYNTGISALLNDGMEWVDKIEDTLRIFKKKQNEMILLWRPHPLIESTMGSMRPNVLEKYLKLKKQFILEGWGIFDDTTDMNRALAISDAYYGDGSSMVELFRAQGKPVMIQNSKVIYKHLPIS